MFLWVKAISTASLLKMSFTNKLDYKHYKHFGSTATTLEITLCKFFLIVNHYEWNFKADMQFLPYQSHYRFMLYVNF